MVARYDDGYRWLPHYTAAHGALSLGGGGGVQIASMEAQVNKMRESVKRGRLRREEIFSETLEVESSVLEVCCCLVTFCLVLAGPFPGWFDLACVCVCVCALQTSVEVGEVDV